MRHDDYGTIPTTYEVYALILKTHQKDLGVFSSYSAPEGDYFGDSRIGRMYTAWGFTNSDYPIMEAETTWDIAYNETGNQIRDNEKHEYRLCLPKKNEEV